MQLYGTLIVPQLVEKLCASYGTERWKYVKKREVFCVTVLVADILYQWQMNEIQVWSTGGMIWALENQSTRSKICPSATLSITIWWCEFHHAFNPYNRYVLWLQSVNMHQALELHFCVCVCVFCAVLCCAVHNGWWIIVLQHRILQSREGPLWVTGNMCFAVKHNKLSLNSSVTAICFGLTDYNT